MSTYRSGLVPVCYALDCPVQLVGRNVPLVMRSLYVDPASGQQHSIETVYQPCAKDRKETFLTKDGPMFKLREGVSSYPDSPLILSGLQELKDRVKLLLILRTAEQVGVCTPPVLHWSTVQVLVAPGLVCFPLPCTEHTDNLTVRDKKALYAGLVQNL